MTRSQETPGSPSVDESVRLTADDNCVLFALADTDPEVVGFVKAGGLGPDPVTAAKQYLRLGFIVGTTGPHQATLADLFRASQRIDALREVPQQVAALLGSEIGVQLARVIGDGERPGALSTALDVITMDAATRFTKVIAPIQEKLFGSDTSALPQVLETRLTAALGKEASAVLERAFATDGTSPLMIHLGNDAKAIAAMRQEMAAVEGRLRDLITALATQVAVQKAAVDPVEAGRDWEPAVIDDVARVTAILGDTVEAVGNTPGHGRALKGDGILHVADNTVSGLKVAIECRTGTSRPVTVGDLRKAVTNRDAHAGLLLADRPELLPRDARATGFRIYWPERLVVLCHERSQPNAGQMLATAVQISRILAKVAVSAPGMLADRETVRLAIGRIETALGHLRPLRASIGGVEKETGRISEYTAQLEHEIRKALTDLITLAGGDNPPQHGQPPELPAT